MTPARQTMTATPTLAGAEAVHLMLTEGDVRMMAENPEQVIQEIELRATVLSSVLTDILSEPHDRPDWGLND